MKEIKIERSITNRSQDSLERYLKDISRYPLLYAEEEIILAGKIRDGDQAALHRLVSCNLRFVVTVAKKYEMQGIPLADLIAEGNLGLYKAAERFDETRGFKFISYAVWWIRQSILFSISGYKRLVRLPMNQVNGILELWKSEIYLEQYLERSPTKEELAEFMKIPEELVRDYLSCPGTSVSLDASFEDQDGGMTMAAIKDTTSLLPDADLEKEALKSDIALIMDVLSPRERNILCLSYGMENNSPMQNEAIGRRLGLSLETIRRYKKSALTRLRELKEIKMMQSYL
jgi:RNA polymerase primary sigma factor